MATEPGMTTRAQSAQGEPAVAGTPSTQFRYEFVTGDVDETLPLIYLWEIEGDDASPGYRYVGKSINGSHRPRSAYRLNVNRLLTGKPYRKGKPDGFRPVHRRLAEAATAGHPIKLRLLCNVAPGEDIFERERHWQKEFRVDERDVGLDADSLEQRIAEAHILGLLGAEIGAPIVPGIRDGMHFDGVLEDPPTLVEVWAHQGPPKPAQKHKVMADALKLMHGDRRLFGGRARKILALASDEAAGVFREGSWMASALQDLGIEVRVMRLPPEELERLARAQARQARGNR